MEQKFSNLFGSRHEQKRTPEGISSTIDQDPKTRMEKIKEYADKYISRDDIHGYVDAHRKEPKTGIWPFRKGEYTVYLSAIVRDGSPLGAGMIEIKLIENGRFRRATSAVREGVKMVENIKFDLVPRK